MPVVETNGLTKTYKTLRRSSVTAIDNVNLSIESGQVHGFLGPNGSGKTTTIRCLLGLIRPSQGTIRLFGQDTTRSVQPVIHNVGSLVEVPKFFPTLSGRRNLKLLATVAGVPDKKIDESLAAVDLSTRADDVFKSYSLGMKQRLGIAATLLKDPELIVLDEPANGMDPAGIVEIRRLVRQLASDGKTIFISSHQLREMQDTCDVVTILSEGRVRATGTVEELIATNASNRLSISVADPAKASTILQANGFDVSTASSPGWLSVEAEPEQGKAITATLAAKGVYLDGMAAQKGSLESAFFRITGQDES